MRTAATLAAVAAVLAPGGSNFSWYQVDRPSPGVCVREPYGVIPNFGRPDARSAIEAELAQMIAAGQRRLRIGIFHGRGFDTGTVMDSTGGDLSAQNRRNLSDLLAAIRRAGFTQIEVAFHPEGPAVAEWTSWDQSRFDENWHLIRNLRPIIRGAGLPYRIDLSNEAIPRAWQGLMLRYSRTLWSDYVRTYGRADTVGFSVVADPAHVAQIPSVYGKKQPYVFDLHFYGGTSGLDESELFRESDRTMRRLGLTQPWILGEAFYDDAVAADQLQSAIAGSTRPIWYLTQWPLTRGSACADVDVPAPTAFGAYAGKGFTRLARPRPVVVGNELRVARTGRVSMTVLCRDSATPCVGTVRLRAGPFNVGPRTFTAVPPRPARVELRVPRALLAQLRRRGRLRALADIAVASEGGAASARAQRRVVLQAPL